DQGALAGVEIAGGGAHGVVAAAADDGGGRLGGGVRCRLGELLGGQDLARLGSRRRGRRGGRGGRGGAAAWPGLGMGGRGRRGGGLGRRRGRGKGTRRSPGGRPGRNHEGESAADQAHAIPPVHRDPPTPPQRRRR